MWTFMFILTVGSFGKFGICPVSFMCLAVFISVVISDIKESAKQKEKSDKEYIKRWHPELMKND